MSDLCDNMKCEFIFREPGCTGECAHFETNMKMVGSIYMVMPDNTDRFVAELPRRPRDQLATSSKTIANSDEPASEYPTPTPILPPLEQA